MKYRKKPVVIEAMKFLGPFSFDDMNMEWDKFPGTLRGDIILTIHIFTLEGVMQANIGDWIIKGVKGEFYPCKDDIFEMTYEAVEK